MQLLHKYFLNAYFVPWEGYQNRDVESKLRPDPHPTILANCVQFLALDFLSRKMGEMRPTS